MTWRSPGLGTVFVVAVRDQPEQVTAELGSGRHVPRATPERPGLPSR